jgi:CBS domain-containing protein
VITFSQLRRFGVVDGSGHREQLVDVSAALLEGEYPPVTHVVVTHSKEGQVVLPWSAVQSLDARAKLLRIDDFEAGEPLRPEAFDGETLLGRDVLDGVVLDLQNRRTTRANDLLLEEEGGQLFLRAADTSVRAILRRVTRGLVGDPKDRAIYDWKYVEFLRGDPAGARSGAGEHLRIARLPPGEIAQLTASIPYLHAAELLTLLPDALAADALEAMPPERQLQLFEELREEDGLEILALMAPDLATDLVGRLQPALARWYLERLPAGARERIIDLLRYPEDTVGGIMTNDVVVAPAGRTAGETRSALRERLKEPDFVHFVYVVDDEETRSLVGVVTLRNLVVADDDQPIEDVMNPYLITLQPLSPARAAAFRIIDSRLPALPVVGDKQRLLGTVTVDAAVALVAPPSWSAQAPRVFS